MKKGFSVLVILSLLLGVLVTTASAQVEYNSGFQVQNLSSTDANITITYYPQSGTEVDVSDTIAANSSKTYYPIHEAVGTTFNGSVVVSSNQPVAAIVNTLGDNPQYAAATGGFSAGSTSFALPLVMCDNNGFDTWFGVQNTGSSNAEVTINYIPGDDGVAGSEQATIQPGRSATFDQTAGSSTVNCDTLRGSDTRFVGSAVITSDQPVVATVMQLNTSNYQIMLGYNGFAGGSGDVRAPLIMGNNNGFYTGIQVQNVGDAETTVTVDYADDASGSGRVLTDDTFTLQANESKTIIHAGAPANNGGSNDFSDGVRYVGAATVTSSNGQPLVAIVNQAFPGPSTGPYGTAYEGFDPSAATNSASAPLIMANNFTYYTGIQVQNVGSSAVAVVIDYGPNSGGTFNPVNETYNLEPGNSYTIIQNGTAANNGGANDFSTEMYVGSATISADGPIVAIVNEFSAGVAGDQFFTYDAFNFE